ncbi:MAG: Hsp70 family protein [Acidimicrobiales bacterium]
MTDWAIGIDLGSARTAAVAAAVPDAPATAPAGPVRDAGAARLVPLEVAGRRAVPSVVARDQTGDLLAGDAALEEASRRPAAAERSLTAVIGQRAPLLLGDAPVDVRDAVAAVLRLVVDEGRLRHGGRPPRVAVLTHPAAWAEVRGRALREAAAVLGIADVRLVPEPVAAAEHYGDALAPGATVAVFDLGASSLDASVVRRGADGFEIVGVPATDDTTGGDRFDHLLLRWTVDQLAAVDADAWGGALDDADVSRMTALMDEVRRAKEALSSYTSTRIAIGDTEVLVNRSQFEAMIVDDVERAVDALARTVEAAGVALDDLAAVHLVGGSARIPLVAQLVAERVGAARVVTRDDPKSVVAWGAARLAARALADVAAGTTAERTNDTTTEPAERAPSTGRDFGPPTPAAPSTLRPPTPLSPPSPAPVVAAAPAPASLTAPPAASVAWRAAVPPSIGRLAADAGGVVVGDRDGVVRALDGATGRVLWQAGVNAPVWAAPGLDGDLVAVAGVDGRVGALDRRTGRARWWATLGAAIGAAPVVTADAVLVGDDSGHVTGLDRTTGAVRWRLPVGSAVRADLASTGSGAIAATVGGDVYAIDGATGACRWGYRMAAGASTSPAIVADRVVVPSDAGVVYALRLASGEPVFGVRGEGRCVTSVAGSLGVFAVVDDARLLRVHRGDQGDAVVEVDLTRVAAGPDVSGEASGVVLVPFPAPTLAMVELGGALVAIDLRDGGVRSTLPTGGGNRTPPVRSGGLVVAPTTFGQLLGLLPA